MEHINKSVGKYRLTRFIGEGGMASVYEGTHEKLGTKVAVKILNPILTANKQIRMRFENEAKFMASLDHPNITRVLDYDEQPDMLAIVMELISGQNLSTLIGNKGALKPAEAVPLFSQILEAFRYAHGKGIVHRDIKPSNIFITQDNQVKILDFGIAKIIGSGDDLTQTGAQIGTPVYMSPEQVKADKTIDHRSDIYSLGVTLYYLLKGEPPYDATTNSSFQIYTRIVQEPLPDLQKFPEIDKVIKKATSKDRALRFQSCGDFKKALLEATQPKETRQPKAASPVDMEKTLIDIPKPEPESKKKSEPTKKSELVKAEKKPEKKPVDRKPEKPETIKKAGKTPGTGHKSKIKRFAFAGIGVLVVAAIVLFALQPGLFLKIFNPSELQRRKVARQAEAAQYLSKAKAEYDKAFAAQNFDTAVYYLKKAAELDQENPEIFYFLSDALYRTVSKDGLDLTGLNYKTIAEASTAIETTIKLNPAYTNEFRNHDIHSRLTVWWGELALHYFAAGKKDSALIAFSEGKKR